MERPQTCCRSGVDLPGIHLGAFIMQHPRQLLPQPLELLQTSITSVKYTRSAPVVLMTMGKGWIDLPRSQNYCGWIGKKPVDHLGDPVWSSEQTLSKALGGVGWISTFHQVVFGEMWRREASSGMALRDPKLVSVFPKKTRIIPCPRFEGTSPPAHRVWSSR